MTPMQDQYNKIKAEYSDSIVLFRLGDFYEVFDEDAKLVSKVLGITLTSRGKDENRRPMAGIPCHALSNYLPKLLGTNAKIVIADQTEEAQPGKLVDRKVTKIITPGTIIDATNLKDAENNFIASIYQTDNDKSSSIFCVAYADISTGEINIFDTQDVKSLKQELEKISPAEIITSNVNTISTVFNKAFISEFRSKPEIEKCKQILKEHFKVENLNFLLPNNLTDQIKQGITFSLGELISYLNDTQKILNKHLNKVTYIDFSPYLQIDFSTIRNLEIFISNSGDEKNTLYGVINECRTAMGKRLLRQWILKPLKDGNLICERNKIVDKLFKNNIILDECRKILDRIGDIERLSAKIGNATINPKEMVSLKKFIIETKNLNSELRAIYKIYNEEDEEEINSFVKLLETTLAEDPPALVSQGDVIAEGYNSEVDRLRSLTQNSKKTLAEIQQKEIELTKISSLKIGFNQVYGYYIEVSKSNVSKVPDRYIRKQSLANAERYVTQELKMLEEEILTAGSKLVELESSLYKDLVVKSSDYLKTILTIARRIAEVDVLANFAHIARKYHYVQPQISDENNSNEDLILSGRHPVVERIVDKFIPNDTKFNDQERVHIITGPNMSGKSTYIRQVALIYLLAQIGSFVPAKKFVFTPLEKLFTRIGTADYLSKGESTFMVEMIETANILNNANNKSLIILDEVGRGTSTYDGVAIAWSIIEYVSKEIKAKTLFATHYHELVELEKHIPSIVNYTIEVEEENNEIRFRHKIIRGSASRSYGVHVAKMAGVPAKVVKRANEILNLFESHQRTKNEITKSPDRFSSKKVLSGKPAQISPDAIELWS